MIDFLTISTRSKKSGVVEVYPKFIIKKSSDLMIRGSDFYAVWMEDRGLWSTEEDDLIQLVDRELDEYADKMKATSEGSVGSIYVMYMRDADSGSIDAWHKYCQKQSRDNFHMLDEKLIFSNTPTNKKDYASKRLNYPLEAGEMAGYEKLMSTLYDEKERHKLEWAIGSIVTGDSKTLQKFMVLYGAAGTGKSTVLNIIERLFDGYFSVFDAKALGSSSNAFALEAFKNNPLVAIQHDGDLSKIEDNTRLNSLVSHELMTINEKFKSTYSNSFKAFLFMGTNKPVKITDAKSGLIRRLIDVTPSGNKLSLKEYRAAVKRVDFELGAIAYHCREVYLSDPNAYDDYIPIDMMGATNDFYNYVSEMYFTFKQEDGVTLKSAWEAYKTYCDDAKVPYPFSQRNFKEELKNYFRDYMERGTLEDGTRVRSYYSGFKTDKFDGPDDDNVEPVVSNRHLIKFESQPSVFDAECANCPAQYASSNETPLKAWDNVTKTLRDLNTSKLHYVKVPENHIVIDFDIKGPDGSKSFERNVEEASKWPPTYAELSKSGAGVHLHYIYNGDVTKLSRIYDENIEIKVFTGKSSLRRKLTKCNDLAIATISTGLPLKGEDKVVDWTGVKSEKILRTMIKRNLNKEYHGATTPSIHFINKILDDAYNSGLSYDVSDMRNAVLNFAANSTNQSDACIKMVNQMKFKSEEIGGVASAADESSSEPPIVFYDVEVMPNLFIVCWKIRGEGKPVVKMINPKPHEIEGLLKYRLIGFNNRKYDNHILYARLMGYTNEQLFDLSNRIINSKKGENKGCYFGPAYNLSYTDIYDFAAKKQSLKKWEIELSIHHQELGLPWDKPVPEELWEKVADYCCNDVVATEAVFEHLAGDWIARQILAELSGGSVNDTTNTLTTKIIFGNEKKPKLVYTDLATGEQFYDGSTPSAKTLNNSFPGYSFEYSDKDKKYHNMYRGTDIGFGGYIISYPGIYGNVALLDVASLHPNSIRAMNCFGEYTKNFTDIIDARVAIKHKDFDSARKMLDGKLAHYLDDESKAKDLAQALKIAINSVYGLTAASFDNPFRDKRNRNNIVALRGALFMRTLQDEIENRGFQIVAVKTDSVKIADATKEIIEFCMDFAKRYGYTFEHEATYDRICQVNDADYVAKYKEPEWCITHYGYAPGENAKHGGEWTVTGARFAVPYVFKKLFSHEDIEFEDLCETKEVKTALYLDMNENLPENEHDYHFIGKVGLFCPIKPGCGGGLLLREAKDGDGNIKYDSATGAKGYRWLEAEMVNELGKEADIDRSYYDSLVDDAIYGSGTGKQRKPGIADFGDYEWFVSDDHYIGPQYDSNGRPVYYPFEANYHDPVSDDSPPWDEDDDGGSFDRR